MKKREFGEQVALAIIREFTREADPYPVVVENTDEALGFKAKGHTWWVSLLVTTSGAIRYEEDWVGSKHKNIWEVVPGEGGISIKYVGMANEPLKPPRWLLRALEEAPQEEGAEGEEEVEA